MFGLKKFLFRQGAPDHLPDDVKSTLEHWQQLAAPDSAELHFHTRYVVVDIATTGGNSDEDQVLAIAAISVQRNKLCTDDAFFVDLSGSADPQMIARQLAAFLLFIGKASLVTYHEPYVGNFLQRLLKSQLGLNFQPPWIDLAWLLPSMFEERSHSPMPLDFWIESFALDSGEERRDAMVNTLLLARLFQMLLVRVIARGIDNSVRLLDESRASSFLRRTH